MSEPRPLGIQASLDLIKRLQETIKEYVRRESELTRAIGLSTYTHEKNREEFLESEQARLKSAIKQIEEQCETAEEHEKTRYEGRKQRIDRAWKNSKQSFLRKLEENEGQQKYSIQKTMLDTEKKYHAALARADSEHEEFQEALRKDRAIFSSLLSLARKSFRGYPRFLKSLSARLKSNAEEEYDFVAIGSESELREELHKQVQSADTKLLAFRKNFLPRFFSILPLSLACILIALLHLPVIPALNHVGVENISWTAIGISAAGFIVATIFVHALGGVPRRPEVDEITETLGKARQLIDHCEKTLEASHQDRRNRLKEEYESTSTRLDSQWNEVLENSEETKQAKPEVAIDEKKKRISAALEQRHKSRTQQIKDKCKESIHTLKEESKQLTKSAHDSSAAGVGQAEEEYEKNRATLIEEWNDTVEPLYSTMEANCDWAVENFPDWSSSYWKEWSPPDSFCNFSKFGELEIDLATLCGELPKDEKLALPGPDTFSLPMMLELPRHCSLLLESSESGQEESVATLNHLILTLLAKAPPGRVSFSIIDPVGLGENFSSIMHLADYENNLINDRIWTQTEQIDKRLDELNEHMEKVIQMYLRNEYETIAEYNEQAGNIAEKYHFLVVADFPANFSDVAAKRLLSIAASGARCGVYTLIHWDTRRTLPQDFVAEEFRKSSTCIRCESNGFALSNFSPPGISLSMDKPPDPDTCTDLILRIGEGSKDANRIEVPFSHVTPAQEELWTGDTTDELRVAIGRTGATKLQYLAIGKATRQHTLIAGKTGSGKSTLFHVIISNLALSCSPEQVEFYLIDFKKGIEFKCYATHRLPHARVIAIESDREFGLSVLQRVDEELKRRGDMFRKLGCQDLAGYKKAGGTELVPRSLLMIDEFQELFVEDDRISQNASMLLDRIVRQGRAFGIHVILGSQTLGGAYTLPRTTLGQMVIRIALQCNEADAYLIMDENNPAPRLLSRPGEGIYNDSAGAVEGNSPFQTVWISDEERDEALEQVAQLAEERGRPYPDAIVFEGNAPADVRENDKLQAALNTPPTASSTSRSWLGAPNSIKGPTEAVFHRQSGNNLLVVGQNDEASHAIASLSLVSLAAQQPADHARFYLFDGNPPDSSQRELFLSMEKSLPHQVSVVAAGGIPEAITEVTQELNRRSEDPTVADEAGGLYVIINGLQRFKKLRYEEDFGFSMDDDDSPADPGAQLDRIIQEGASLGIHLIVICDTFNNVNRFLSRKALSEFEMRVLFQMSANDSASLIDTPKASQLGLNRALFYNEQEGYLETFRPYAPPDPEWFEETVKQLSEHAQTTAS